MPEPALSGSEFKKQLHQGTPKVGLFLNSHSPTVAEQIAHSGYDWLLVDTQHGPMDHEKLSAMLCGIASGGAKSIFRRRIRRSPRHPAGSRSRRSTLHDHATNCVVARRE